MATTAKATKAPKVPKDPNALTRHQAKLRDRIAGCGGVFRSRTGEAGAGGETWYFVNAPGAPPTGTLQRLIRKGALVPQNDGLFPGESQTYVARSA